jgi:uncharacterized protein (DUF2147 family)
MQCLNLLRIVASVGIVAGLLAAGALPASRAVAAPPVQQGAGDRIVGDWRPTDQDVTVRIFANNGQYLGAIVQAADQQMINRELIRSLVFDPAMGTWHGEVFAIKQGKFMPMTIRMTPAGLDMVAGSGVFSKTINWVRVQ